MIDIVLFGIPNTWGTIIGITFSVLYFLLITWHVYSIYSKEYPQDITIFSYVVFIVTLVVTLINLFLERYDIYLFDNSEGKRSLIQKQRIFFIIILLNILSIIFGYLSNSWRGSVSGSSWNKNAGFSVYSILYVLCITVVLGIIYFKMSDITMLFNYIYGNFKEEITDEKEKKANTKEERELARRIEMSDDIYK